MLLSWERTPYVPGQRARGEAANCTGFLTGVLDDLYGFERIPLPRLPDDMGFHNREAALAALRVLLRAYPDHVAVCDDSVQPGDVVVVGAPGPDGVGPGHVLIGGHQPNTLWHAIKPWVCFTGVMFDASMCEVVSVYRMTDRVRWLREVA